MIGYVVLKDHCSCCVENELEEARERMGRGAVRMRFSCTFELKLLKLEWAVEIEN